MQLEKYLLLDGKARKVFLRDYVKKVLIGAYDSEKVTPQDVRFNIEVWLPNVDVKDSLAFAFNYERISQIVEEVTSRGHFELQETLAEAVGHALVEEEFVLAARVKTEKLEVLSGGASYGVEIFVESDD